MDNPEKWSTLGTKDEDKQNKNRKQYEFDAITHKQTP
jgi:hypothetical protein